MATIFPLHYVIESLPFEIPSIVTLVVWLIIVFLVLRFLQWTYIRLSKSPFVHK
jgi:uncharacterized protein HemY